jgi:hypothetical protein
MKTMRNRIVAPSTKKPPGEVISDDRPAWRRVVEQEGEAPKEEAIHDPPVRIQCHDRMVTARNDLILLDPAVEKGVPRDLAVKMPSSVHQARMPGLVDPAVTMPDHQRVQAVKKIKRKRIDRVDEDRVVERNGLPSPAAEKVGLQDLAARRVGLQAAREAAATNDDRPGQAVEKTELLDPVARKENLLDLAARKEDLWLDLAARKEDVRGPVAEREGIEGPVARTADHQQDLLARKE